MDDQARRVAPAGAAGVGGRGRHHGGGRSRVSLGRRPAARSGSIVLQYQTANLTEAQYEPVWKAIIAKFEAQNPTIKVEPILVARKTTGRSS